MCTLTVVTGHNNYLLAMNRDEKIARGAGELPEIHQLHGTSVIYPNDGATGTWISANSYGITLALLNWNDISHVLDGPNMRSRGQIIPALGSSSSAAELQWTFGALNLRTISPFRLVAVCPSDKEIGEWRWDMSKLELRIHPWGARHWFSSSLSDKEAENLRGAACREAWSDADAGSPSWLRRLHASHVGGPGPFSLCVHRHDVETLSYSEVTCAQGAIQMAHCRGNPCTIGELRTIAIERTHGSDTHAWAAGNLAV